MNPFGFCKKLYKEIDHGRIMKANRNYVKIWIFFSFESLKHNMQVYFRLRATVVNVKFCKQIFHLSIIAVCTSFGTQEWVSRKIVNQNFIGGAKKFAFHDRSDWIRVVVKTEVRLSFNSFFLSKCSKLLCFCLYFESMHA